MSHSWDEVQALLDDPFVDGDTKEHLLHAYLRENDYVDIGDYSNVPPEVQEYVDSYSLEGGDDEGSLDEVYERAQNESDTRGQQHRQVEEDLDSARSELDDMQPPAPTGSGVETSDDIFELARPALRVFDTWLPINDQVPDNLLGTHRRISREDIETRFDEQKGIDFRKFLEDADRIRQAHTTLDELNTTTEGELTSLYQSWTGPAANASYDHYSRQLAPKTSALLEALAAIPEAIEAAVAEVYEACRAKAEEVMEVYTPTVGEAPPDIAERMVRMARGEDVSDDELKTVASFIDRVSGNGSALENAVSDGDIAKMQVAPQIYAWSTAWIQDAFNPHLHDYLYEEKFDQACEAALEAINTAYEELNAVLGEYENEFSDASTLQLAPPPGPTPDTATGPAGSGLTPGSGGGGVSLPAPPPVNLPPPPTPSLAGTGAGLDGPQGTAPSALAPPTLGTPGEQWSPVTSPPGTGEPETVTIDDGARQISVTSPDGHGTVTITIDDGGGEPTTYHLDFGAATGIDSPEPGPREARSMPVPTQQIPGDLGTGGGSGPFAPDAPPSPGAEAVRAGPDGMVVIEDGDLTISAERPPGSPNQVVITVDDGAGDPSTYTVDYADSANPTVNPTESTRTAGLATVGYPSDSGGAAVLGGQAGSIGAPDPGQYTSVTVPGGGHYGESGLASVSEDGGRPAGSTGAPGAGMPMMGAMGAAGAGDAAHERSASAWRTAGDLFDDDQPDARFRGVIG